MLSEASKIQYAKAVLRRQYTGDSQTVGPLVANKFYRITKFVTGDDFGNVGIPTKITFGSKGRTGMIFQATGIAPTVWTAGSKLTELKVVDLRAKADEVFNAATDTITLTSTSFEGGSQAGQITFEKAELGMAIESLLAEMDPDYVPNTSAATPRRQSSYRVLMG
jgi:hypothetical protein